MYCLFLHVEAHSSIIRQLIDCLHLKEFAPQIQVDEEAKQERRTEDGGQLAF